MIFDDKGGGGVQNTPKIDDVVSEQPLKQSWEYGGEATWWERSEMHLCARTTAIKMQSSP